MWVAWGPGGHGRGDRTLLGAGERPQGGDWTHTTDTRREGPGTGATPCVYLCLWRLGGAGVSCFLRMGSWGCAAGGGRFLMRLLPPAPCRYCHQCQSQVPPRSGHCSACRVCILRRDHHCRLLDRCVGFHNYRPFLCLLLHAAGVLLHISVLLGPALAALLRTQAPLHTAALLLLPWLMLLTGGAPWVSPGWVGGGDPAPGAGGASERGWCAG